MTNTPYTFTNEADNTGHPYPEKLTVKKAGLRLVGWESNQLVTF